MENTQTPMKKKKKGGAKKAIRTVLVIAVILAVLAAAAWALKTFVFTEEKREILRDTAMIGTISNQVQGYGYTKALDSATITLLTGGKVLDVYVSEGDTVEAGDPLYDIDATAARETLAEAQKSVRDVQKQIRAIEDTYQDLTVKAPFSGKLLDVTELQPGQQIGFGERIATIADDSTMKLRLYYSYAYESAVQPGQTAAVSIPVSMSSLTGKVESVEKVRYITPEGTMCFQATIAVTNPGTLAEGMEASAVLQSADGEAIYAYDGGKLEYSRKTDVVTRASGEILTRNLLNYADVTAGAVLLTISEKDNADELDALARQLKTAQEAEQKAQKTLDSFHGVAPIGGTVLSCGLVAGETASDGAAAVTIADTSVMLVTVDLDERNIGYVTVGMPIELTDWDGNSYYGEVTNVSLTGKMENGAATFPMTIRVDNAAGLLMSSMTVNYSFQASRAEDCLVVPVQAVKNVSDAQGEPMTVVFVELPERPENAVDVPEGFSGVPTEADGFYAVPVETGISDVYNVQILSGLQEGDTVFTSYMLPEEDGYGIYG